jgi:hypothetical protein
MQRQRPPTKQYLPLTQVPRFTDWFDNKLFGYNEQRRKEISQMRHRHGELLFDKMLSMLEVHGT